MSACWHGKQFGYRYVVSTGGQSEHSDGIYLRQNCDMEHEVGVGVGTRLWKALFHLPVNSWTHVALTFSQSAGLKVYVDAQPVVTDTTGSQRLYVDSAFSQFVNILVGQPNDLQLDQNLPGVAAWKLTHADAVYSKTDIVTLAGMHTNAADTLV